MAASALRLGLESDLRAEREQRQSLQRSLQREQDNSVELRTQLQQLQGLHEVSGGVGVEHGHADERSVRCVHCGVMGQELRSLKEEKQQLQQKCELQEQTLQEMGLHLSQSVLPPPLTNSQPLLIFMGLSFFFFFS